MCRTKYNCGDIVKVLSLWTAISPVEIWHYGVVVDNDEVVHFNLSERNDICIIKSDLNRFINGGSQLQICRLSNSNKKFSSAEIAARAESQVGCDFGGYDLFSNNCEHFANWCASGEKYSNQIWILDEGEGHTIAEKVAENVILEPILKNIEDACDYVDDVSEKTDDFFSKLIEKFPDGIF